MRIKQQTCANPAYVLAVTLALLNSVGCGGEVPGVGGSAAADRYDCEAFTPPARLDTSACSDVDATQPEKLVACLRGSGHLGRWTVDAAGLPAYDFTVEQRCDLVAHAYSPRQAALRDPIHVIGNGRGLVAMAHASGGVEIYTQDRGHKWINHVDTWNDAQNPDYPPQLGGGFNYYSVDRTRSVRVGSTRFEDLPVNRATQMQTRRFGVGYVETITRDGDINLRRRVFAPDAAARALVAQLTVENPTGRPQHYEVVEFWDVNLHQITLELLTSDLGLAGVTEGIDRRRRALAAQFQQHIEWRADQRLAVVTTTAKSMPSNVHDRLDVSRTDYFPDPLYLAVLDDGPAPDGVWLSDAELWDGAERTPPAAVARPADAASRTLDLDGDGQHAVLAVRVPVDVPAHGAVTRRFAFGYSPGGAAPDAAVAELRAHNDTLQHDTEVAWRSRLVWAAFPGLQDAGVVQRELAWAAYSALAMTTFDEYRNVLLLGQGGAYKYIHGIDGAMGDLALFAEAVTLIDPHIARDTLTYALATQLGGAQRTPWRFPYATTGVGAFTDVLIYDQRSDGYYFLPAAIGRYVALTRDHTFLDQRVPFYPRARARAATCWSTSAAPSTMAPRLWASAPAESLLSVRGTTPTASRRWPPSRRRLPAHPRPTTPEPSFMGSRWPPMSWLRATRHWRSACEHWPLHRRRPSMRKRGPATTSTAGSLIAAIRSRRRSSSSNRKSCRCWRGSSTRRAATWH